jgi:hypothetical protein
MLRRGHYTQQAPDESKRTKTALTIGDVKVKLSLESLLKQGEGRR